MDQFNEIKIHSLGSLQSLIHHHIDSLGMCKLYYFHSFIHYFSPSLWSHLDDWPWIEHSKQWKRRGKSEKKKTLDDLIVRSIHGTKCVFIAPYRQPYIAGYWSEDFPISLLALTQTQASGKPFLRAVGRRDLLTCTNIIISLMCAMIWLLSCSFPANVARKLSIIHRRRWSRHSRH